MWRHRMSSNWPASRRIHAHRRRHLRIHILMISSGISSLWRTWSGRHRLQTRDWIFNRSIDLTRFATLDLLGLQIFGRNAFHAIHFDFNRLSIGQSIRNLINILLMDLHAVNGEARTGIELLVAQRAFEMFRLLVLNEDLLVIEVAIAIPAPWLRCLLLLSAHIPLTSKSF